MDCPRCGQSDVAGPACPRCGVVFAKLKPPRPRPAPVAAATPPQPRAGSSAWLLASLTVVALLAWWFLKRAPEAAAPESPTRVVQPPAAASLPSAALPPAQATSEPPPLTLLPADGLSQADLDQTNALVRKVNSRARLSEADLRFAQEFFARHAEEPRARELLAATLLLAASQARDARRYPEAIAHAKRAAALLPSSTEARGVLLALLLDTADWPAAEAVARELVALDARDADAQYGLGYALFRQDRNREAVDALEVSLAIRETPVARALLERLRKGEKDERGMSEQQLAHFHVRYDGETHEEVGREVLRVLERHYATLVQTFDHEPQSPIPVILFSREQYYNASGAPAWSGGVYDTLDGRIRIPIGGLTAALSPEMDGTVLHEVTHSFVFDISRGLAPREIQEGLAQYMEGKRSGSDFSAQQLTALADGRGTGVGAFYAGALSFTERLIDTRGMGGINDLLRAMGETGDVNQAFRRVYGGDFAGTQREWREWLRGRYGS